MRTTWDAVPSVPCPPTMSGFSPWKRMTNVLCGTGVRQRAKTAGLHNSDIPMHPASPLHEMRMYLHR